MRILWSISHRGPKAELLEALARAQIPEHAKAHLAELVNASPHAGLVLDSHAHQTETLVTVATSLARLY